MKCILQGSVSVEWPRAFNADCWPRRAPALAPILHWATVRLLWFALIVLYWRTLTSKPSGICLANARKMYVISTTWWPLSFLYIFLRLALIACEANATSLEGLVRYFSGSFRSNELILLRVVVAFCWSAMTRHLVLMALHFTALECIEV